MMNRKSGSYKVKIKLNKIYILYLLLFVISELPGSRNLSFFIVFLVNIFILLSNRKNTTFVLLVSLIIGNELLAILSTVMCLIVGRRNIDVKRIKSSHLIFYAVVIATSLINALIYNTIWNLIFEIIYLLVLLFIALYSEQIIKRETILPSIRYLLLTEAVVMTIQILKYRSLEPGDLYRGTFSSAHWFGNWMVCALVLLFIFNSKDRMRKWKDNLKGNFPYCIVALYCLYFSDAKHVILSFAVGIVCYLIFNKLFEKRSFFAFVISSYTVFFVISLVYKNPFVQDLLSGLSKEFATYFYSASFNGKFNYIFGVLNSDLIGIHAPFGYGLGQFGSRISNLFAYNVMYRTDNTINNFIANTFAPHYIKAYADYVSFYDAEFVNRIQYISAVLSYPFNDFIAFIAETGVVGVVGFSFIINNFIQTSRAKVVAFYFFIACFFDIYFGDFSCIAIVIIVIELAKNRKI